MLEACCYTCCTVLVVVVVLLPSSKSIYSTLCGISFFSPSLPQHLGGGGGGSVSDMERRRGQRRSGGRPLRFRFMAQRNMECVAAVCPFSMPPPCLRMRPGCQRRRPPTDDRRGAGGPETKYGKNPSCQILQRNGWREKEKKYPFAALFFFVPFLLPFLPISPTCCTTLCLYPISGSPQPFFIPLPPPQRSERNIHASITPFWALALGIGRTEGRKEKREKNHPILDGETTQ